MEVKDEVGVVIGVIVIVYFVVDLIIAAIAIVMNEPSILITHCYCGRRA